MSHVASPDGAASRDYYWLGIRILLEGYSSVSLCLAGVSFAIASQRIASVTDATAPVILGKWIAHTLLTFSELERSTNSTDKAVAGRAGRSGWAELALAIGGFGIGTGEFVMMGLLPNVAADLGISVPTAGHIISAYALGVVVGAPLIAVLAARWPRHALGGVAIAAGLGWASTGWVGALLALAGLLIFVVSLAEEGRNARGRVRSGPHPRDPAPSQSPPGRQVRSG
jgi:hypothetical protein